MSKITSFGTGRLARAALACGALLAIAPRLSYGQDTPVPDAFAQNKVLGRGVNIIGYDPIWGDMGKARFKAEYFKALKDAGFDSVRIVLQPFKYMDEGSDKLPGSWLKVLDWAVEGSQQAGLAAILDFHEFTNMGRDPEKYHGRFLEFWRQVAPRYRHAPSSVMFELMNEPSGKLTPEMWNRYLLEALAIVRQTNPTRTVIIGPARWNGIGALKELELPENDRNIIVTVHYYTPMEFTHQGAAWSPENKDRKDVQWLGTGENAGRIAGDFAQAQAWALVHNRPIFLGEFGAYDKAPMESRVRYTAAVARAAEALGWSWAYWQFDSDFILYDVDKDEWVKPILEALIPR